MPENTCVLLLEAPFSPEKEPSKELEITGTETRTKLIHAISLFAGAPKKSNYAKVSQYP
jgi:hypothetical protein